MGFEHRYSSRESYVIIHIIHLYISTLLQMSQCNFSGVATKRYNNTELVQVTHHAACQNWSRCRSICARNSSCAAFSFVNTGNICIMSNISDIVYIKGLTHRSNVLVKKPISEQMAIYNITRVSAPGNGIYKQISSLERTYCYFNSVCLLQEYSLCHIALISLVLYSINSLR